MPLPPPRLKMLDLPTLRSLTPRSHLLMVSPALRLKAATLATPPRKRSFGERGVHVSGSLLVHTHQLVNLVVFYKT